MTSPGTCYRLVVAGHLSQLIVDTINDRFGAAASIRPSGEDTAVLLSADQASLRALLVLLWDVGHELGAVAACRSGPVQGAASPPFSTRGRQGPHRGAPCACRGGTS